MITKEPHGEMFVTLAGICLMILSLWFMGCSKSAHVPTTEEALAAIAEQVDEAIAENGTPAPPDVLAKGPIPFGKSFECPFKGTVLVGRPDPYTVVYALEVGNKMKLFMITLLDPMVPEGYISEAWVDVHGDGSWSQYFNNERALVDAYPTPCAALGRPV